MDLLQVTARTAIGWMIYGLLEGTALAVFVWLLLRLLPRQNAGTRFIFWFSALLAMFFLPLLGAPARTGSVAASTSPGSSTLSLITLPLSWAIAIFAVWALIAAISLARVLAGLWHIHWLRRNSEEVEVKLIGPELTQLMRESRRPVSLRLSDQLHVPTAIGFLKPAIVLPRWFLDQGEISQEELKHVLVHELSHLRRGDDWTNLAQKFIKALLFFHPSAWWVEQQLSLEREMACDDEVLVRTSPLNYAQCLKRVAEKSFLRRQIVLAQAVVGRVRQLSLRVTQILDVNRPSTTKIWKPALPVMVLAASLCGFSAWTAPALVGFSSDAPRPVAPALTADDSHSAPPFVRQVNAGFVYNNFDRRDGVLHRLAQNIDRRDGAQHRLTHRALNNMMSSYRRPAGPSQLLAAASQPMPQASMKTYVTGDYVVQSAQFTVTGAQGTWQVQMWQVRVLAPADQANKAIPRKGT